MCSKQGPTLRELCLHFRLRTFRSGADRVDDEGEKEELLGKYLDIPS